MKRFLLKLILLSVAFFIFDKLFLLIAFNAANIEVDKRLEDLVKGKINKDIIIVGSSVGSRDIIARQIEDKTGFSTYNLCYPGSDVTFHKFVLETLYKFNKAPKYIILIVDDDVELIYDKKVVFRKDRLYPLVRYSYIWKRLAKEENRNYLLGELFILFRLNKNNFHFSKKRFTPLDSIKSCGSMPISWKPNKWGYTYNSDNRLYRKENEDVDKVKAYKDIIDLVRFNNSKLIVVFPPVYKAHCRSFENRIRKLTGDNACFYVYDTENPIYKDQEYYFDDSHLMNKGAVIFTYELIDFLRRNDMCNE